MERCGFRLVEPAQDDRVEFVAEDAGNVLGSRVRITSSVEGVLLHVVLGTSADDDSSQAEVALRDTAVLEAGGETGGDGE